MATYLILLNILSIHNIYDYNIYLDVLSLTPRDLHERNTEKRRRRRHGSEQQQCS